MAKRYREFRRINLTAKVAAIIRKCLVDRTFDDHFGKCRDLNDCAHHHNGNMAVSRLVEAGITVGKKRGYLDVACPYSLENPDRQIRILSDLYRRLTAFATSEKNPRTRKAMLRAAQEIIDYATRNAMEVLAETRVDC